MPEIEDMIHKVFSVYQWELRAKDAKLRIVTEDIYECEPTELPSWRMGNDVETSFRELVEKGEEYWNSFECQQREAVVSYDMKRIIVNKKKLEEMNEGITHILWLEMGKAMFMHYLNHMSDFRLNRIINEGPWVEEALRSLSYAKTLANVPLAWDALKNESDVLSARVALRIMAPRELIPPKSTDDVLKIMVHRRTKPLICLTPSFCFEYDIERGILQNDVNLKYFMTAIMSETPPSSSLYGLLSLV